MNRREFISRTTIGSAGVLALAALSSAGADARPRTLAEGSTIAASEPRPRKMTMNLVCGAIGVSAKPPEAIELAARHGFESVEADGNYLASLTDEQLTDLKSTMKEKNLIFGAAGLPLEFRRDDARFQESLKQLPHFAGGLKRAGVDRVSTWLTPCDDKLTYIQNFRQHATRLRQAAVILKDFNVRLGLEYVGPKTSWASRRYPFIHTMAEMRDLLTEINTGNVGYLLDSWHWYHAGDTVNDVLSLKPEEVIAVDLNDAPAGIPKEQQADSRRELPCATGVIDLRGFLTALNQIGYDGPVRVEPFNAALNKLPKDEACAAAAAALKKAFALIG